MTTATPLPILVVIYYCVLIALMPFLLRIACGITGSDVLTYFKSIVIVLGVGAITYFAYDFTAYGIFSLLRSDMFRDVPPNFGYTNWFTLPLGMKWEITGALPFFRYIPVIIAFCLAGVLYVFALEVPFRKAFLIFLIQWVLTFIAIAILSVIFTRINSAMVSGETDTNTPSSPTNVKPVSPKSAPGQEDYSRPAPFAPGSAAHSQAQSSLPKFELKGEDEVTGFYKTMLELGQRVNASKAQLDPALNDLEKEMQPITCHLPTPVQDFLITGGWWVVIGIAAILTALWAYSLFRRIYKVMFGRRKKKKKKKSNAEKPFNLATLAEGFMESGPKVITVKGMPARLRVVIMAPVGATTEHLDRDMVDHLLDLIQPGMGQVVPYDYPRVRVWGKQYSFAGFTQTFHAKVPIPDATNKRSHWVVVTGTVSAGRQSLYVGMALYTEQRTNIGKITVKENEWLDVLGLTRGEVLV